MTARKIRVLHVDDSATVRSVVKSAFAQDPAFDLVGFAENGKIGLEKMVQLKPDLVILDVEMPEMDGLTTLEHIKQQKLDPIVIMFSTLTERGASTTVKALLRGAKDYVAKPSTVVGGVSPGDYLKNELLGKAKALCAVRCGLDVRPATPAAPAVGAAPAGKAAPASAVRAPAPAAAGGPRRPVQIVAIGISTGGPQALSDMLPTLLSPLPVPILIVQHMPPMFTKQLAERLAQRCSFPVHEATAGTELVGGRVFIAPGDYHMVVDRSRGLPRLALNQAPAENSCRPSVDVLFRSVAEVFGRSTLAVVMTGMGSDGLEGCREIRRVGGQVIIQDKATSVVWGMAGLVADAGLADEILPLGRMAHAISERMGAKKAATVVK